MLDNRLTYEIGITFLRGDNNFFDIDISVQYFIWVVDMLKIL